MRRLAAGVTLAAALLLTGGGGGDGEDGSAGGEGAGTPSATAAPETPAEAPAEAPAEEDATEDDGLPEDTVPVEELTPPEGEFTEEQRDYLTDRVPEGADPGAILELGAEACDRLGYLDRHGTREDAVDAVRGGEIPDAEAAIEHLCPEYADLLAEAEGDE